MPRQRGVLAGERAIMAFGTAAPERCRPRLQNGGSDGAYDGGGGGQPAEFPGGEAGGAGVPPSNEAGLLL